jgi:hypothetical protein
MSLVEAAEKFDDLVFKLANLDAALDDFADQIEKLAEPVSFKDELSKRADKIDAKYS